MIVVMEHGTLESQIQDVIKTLESNRFSVNRIDGKRHTILVAIGVEPEFDQRKIELLSGVAEVFRVTEPYKLASKSAKREGTVFDVNGIEIGGNDVVIIAGPCSVENEEQIFTSAREIASTGTRILRGGAFKPRSSPYNFQGLGKEGLKLLRAAADEFKLSVITEVMDRSQIDLIEKYADILQVGARNMQNYDLLKDLAKASKPIMLKRSIAATIDEWLLSAEYLLAGGNEKVILCERGIRSFESSNRTTLDITAIPIIHQKSHLPIFADPSHGAGIRNKVIPMARAAIAAGADGLLVEVHPQPSQAQSDGAQSLFPDQFRQLMKEIRLIAEAIGRKIA